MEEYLKTLLEQIRCKKHMLPFIMKSEGISKNRWQTI